MKRLLLSFKILLVLAIGIYAQEEGRTWQSFAPANEDWKILSPGIMQPDENALKNPQKKATYSFKDFEGFFAVTYRELPRMPKHLDKYYNQTRDNAVKGVQGQLIKEAEFARNGLTGREIYIKVNSSIERARMFFHARRFYVIIAILLAEEIEREAINTFMNSFTVKDINIAKRGK